MTTAVITGGGRGLGRGIALALAATGADLVIGWRHDEQAAINTAKEAGDAIAVRCDVIYPDDIVKLADAATNEFGGIDIWVNNAGISVFSRLLDTTDEQMSSMMDTNYRGTFLGLQVAATRMIAHRTRGVIVNVASDLGLQAAPLLAGYSATKFAVIGLTQAAAVELAPHGIRVNAVCPGTVETGMVLAEEQAEAALTGRTVDQVRARLLSEVPAGRLCEPDDVGALVAWLASPGAEFVTGQAICTNGGSIRH